MEKYAFTFTETYKNLIFLLPQDYIDEDLNYLAEFITLGFGFKNQTFKYVWEQDLKINKLKAKLISKFLSIMTKYSSGILIGNIVHFVWLDI